MKKFIFSVFIVFAFTIISSSCLKEMPEDIPDELTWNPEVAFPVTETFIGMNEESGFEDSLLQINPITGLPFWVELIGVPIHGDADFDMASIVANEEEINRIMVRINAYNGFPVEVLVQAYFIDPQLPEPVDSFFLDGPFILKPGRVKDDGISVSPVYEREEVVFEREDLDKLANVTSVSFETIILNADLDTALIPHYTDYLIDFQLACMVDFTLDL
jgi:hypothetical protein